METNQAYARHRDNIHTVVSSPASPNDFIGDMENKNRNLKRTNKFNTQSKNKEEELANLRLLNRFVEIQKG